MEPELCKIEVLHFKNPYLIWVEVDDCFEQIGVFGVLPLELIIDPEEDTLTSRRTSDWMPAATVLMKNWFEDAIEVSFCPVYVDHRSTIFDDNNHKYGEIVLKKPNGKYKLLSRLLVKSGFAVYDENTFQTELSSGKLKTKLSYNAEKEIIKQLEKICSMPQIAKHTKVFQAAQKLESELTVKNLECHNLRTKIKTDKEEVFQRKLEVLKLCKDVEEESVGRATKKKEEADCSSLLLKKKLKLLKGNSSEKVHVTSREASYYIKQHIEDLNALQKSPKDVNTHHSTPANECDSKRFLMDAGNLKEIENYPVTKNNHHSQISNKINSSINSFEDKDLKQTSHDNVFKMERLSKALENASQIEDNSFQNGNGMMIKDVPKRKKKRTIYKPNKLPEYDVKKETRVAYGPPDTNIASLHCKIVPKATMEKMYYPPQTEDEKHIPMKNEKEDIFGEEDSDVEVEITKQFQEKLKEETESNLPVKYSVFNNPIIANVSLKAQDITKDIPTQPVTPKPDESEQKSPKIETISSSILKRKLRLYKENFSRRISSSTTSDTSNKDSSTSVEDDRFKSHKKDDTNKVNTSKCFDSDGESMNEVIEKLNAEYEPIVSPKKEEQIVSHVPVKNHVNPFKNVDTNISKFVEKLVTPVLMVHSKMNKRFQPTFKLSDVPFNTHIQIVLKNVGIEQPMMLQKVSWSSILRGYSTFVISPKKSGKTMGYLPAVCRLVSDKDSGIDSTGPMSIIVCATSNSVSEVEKFAKLFFSTKDKVLAIYTGMNELHIATSLLNGCDMLICTPAILVRLLQSDFGVDLRRLTSFVLDDCERLTEVFINEIKFFLFKIKDMLKNRVQKEVKVQYILSSRVWCDFMEPLARKAPDTVICIGAFQECVLYSKANTTVSFVTKENKVQSVLDFLKDIDTSKRTVIICRTDGEVEELQKVLTEAKYVVFACNSEMSVQNLYNLRGSWDDYQEPVIGPILVCLDGNLMHLNVTDAHYLIHYSLPSLFSAFCKRFSVLNEYYPSIFKQDNETVRIKIMLEDDNLEQLPKILNFIKRCTTEVPTALDDICEKILLEKEKKKARKLVPICDNLLTLGECPDYWNCQERHVVFKEFDEPQVWVPKEGVISFKILHYHSAVFYSARLLSNTTNSQTVKYPQNHKMLSMKISMFFRRESNRQLHGVPEVGDVCAVCIKYNFFARCQVVKILNFYQNGKPNFVLVRLIDEEKLEKARDIDLYYLPEELKTTQTHVVYVRLANLQPKDKDITFSELARDQLQKISDEEEDLYMRGQISFTIGNCVLLESLETCRDLTTLNKTVVLHDFKNLLLENHALYNAEHLQKLKKLLIEGGMEVSNENTPKVVEVPQLVNMLPSPQWAHLEKDDLSAVWYASAEDPSTFFVRLVKFEDSCATLVNDIQKYAAENTKSLTSVNKGDIVLAKLPDDDLYERARIDEILNEDKVKCFFVDQGDWREVLKKNLIPITEKLITQLPFQAIECRLVGVKPPGENWTEFATIWFTNCFEDNAGNLKQIYAKYFTKEKASYTGGHKYGVLLIDTNSDQDIIINESIMEVNLAEEEESEIGYLNELDFIKETKKTIPKELSDVEDEDEGWEKVSKASKTSSTCDDFVKPNIPLNDLFPKKPIRSVPLIGSDESETSEDRWQINMAKDFMAIFKPVQTQENKSIASNLPAIKNIDSKSSSEVSANSTPCKGSESDSSVQKLSSSSDILVVPTPKIKELDSDDYTSAESSPVTIKTVENKNLLKEIATSRKIRETVTPVQIADTNLPRIEKEGNCVPEPLRKPKLLWHQKKKNVVIKIQLIGVEKYELTIEDRQLKFYAIANDTEYGFDLELYGIIDKNTASHSNKGQYIRIHFNKVIDRNWLTLTKFSGIEKWIVYDVDALDVESSDEENDHDLSKKVIQRLCNEEVNSDSEDEEFLDDINFGYSR